MLQDTSRRMFLSCPPNRRLLSWMEIGSFKFESDKYKAYGAYGACGAQLLSIYLIRRESIQAFRRFRENDVIPRFWFC